MNTDDAPRARDVFLFWEKWLRPSYNALLVVVCLIFARYVAAFQPPMPPDRILFHLITQAVAANILFTAGPFADFYVSVLLRKRHPAVTAVIFGAGALVSVVIAWLSLSLFWWAQEPDFRLGGID